MDNPAFWTLIGLLIPQTIILLDYLFKSLYILYWENIYKKRLFILFDYLKYGHGEITIRRVTSDDYYIINLKSYMLSERPYEYIADGKGNFRILGAKVKTARALFNKEVFIAPINAKIPEKDKKLKKEFVNLINSIYPTTHPSSKIDLGPPTMKEFSSEIKPLGLKVRNTEKPNKILQALDNTVNGKIIEPRKNNKIIKELNYTLGYKQTVEKVDDFIVQLPVGVTTPPLTRERKNIIMKLAMTTFSERNTNESVNLYDIINFSNYIRECVEISKKVEISKDDINELITDKIHDYAENMIELLRN